MKPEHTLCIKVIKIKHMKKSKINLFIHVKHVFPVE